MFGLGVHELLIVGIVAVLLFGRKLPEVARSLGLSYREFRRGLNEFQTSVNVDSYATTSSYSSSSHARHDDYADTPTAPKFEPPAAEPQAIGSSVAQVAPGEEQESQSSGTTDAAASEPEPRRDAGSSYT